MAHDAFQGVGTNPGALRGVGDSGGVGADNNGAVDDARSAISTGSQGSGEKRVGRPRKTQETRSLLPSVPLPPPS